MEGNISSSSGKSATVHFELRELSTQERRKNAFKGLGLFWGLSLAFAPLPPIHWVATPGFFLFGFYWAAKKYGQTTYLRAFSAECPECQGKVDVAERFAQSPTSLVCPHCRYNLKLEWEA